MFASLPPNLFLRVGFSAIMKRIKNFNLGKLF